MSLKASREEGEAGEDMQRDEEDKRYTEKGEERWDMMEQPEIKDESPGEKEEQKNRRMKIELSYRQRKTEIECQPGV